MPLPTPAEFTASITAAEKSATAANKLELAALAHRVKSTGHVFQEQVDHLAAIVNPPKAAPVVEAAKVDAK